MMDRLNHSTSRNTEGEQAQVHHICVYTGSNVGTRQVYQQAARTLGREMSGRGIGMVYGGGRVGLMGIIADEIMAAGGEVIGVMPRALFPSEVGNTNVTRLYEVDSMHERKALMADLSDGFIALPGGFGTLDELFEIITWAQLGIHHKPVGLLNVAGFYDPLLAMVQHLVAEGFVKEYHADLLINREDPSNLLDCVASYLPPAELSKWTELPPAR